MSDKRLWLIAKAHKLADLIIQYHQAVYQGKGDWFKACMLNIQIEQVKASTYHIERELEHENN